MDAECSEEIFGPRHDSLQIVIPLTILYVIVFITGTIGNVSTCIVISKNKSMHTATNYYLFSLAVSDQLLLLSGVPQEIYLFWNRYPYIFGGKFCFVRGLANETSSNATVLIITAFTVERYLAICHPFLAQTMSKLTRAIKLILLVWVLSVCLAIPQAVPLKVIGKCPQCVVEKTIIDYNFEISTFLFFIVPMTIITVLYILIGVKLRSSKTMEKRIITNTRVLRRSSRKVVNMLVAVVVTFFLCWAPFHIQRLYVIYNVPTRETRDTYIQIYGIITYISGFLFYTSATINPILYNIMSAKFRDAFKETFSTCCFRDGRVLATQRSLSIVSKSLTKCQDSTDSGSHNNSLQSVTITVPKNYFGSTGGVGEKAKIVNV